MNIARIVRMDGSVSELPVAMDGERAVLAREVIPQDTDRIEFLPRFCDAPVGSEGYYIVPTIDNNGHAGQIFFRPRELPEADRECVFDRNGMPLYVFHNGRYATLVVVEGMALDYDLVTGIEDGRYYLYPRFALEGDGAHEDIVLRFYKIDGPDADWCRAARRYRQHQLERGACRPLRERMKDFPVAGEAARGPEVRIRLAWKPVPSPVPEQTEENEPPVHVAITFEQCERIVEEFHRQGIDHAEFCLVGWNKSGHDGRFPDLFPVEPLLGGEAALRRLIEKARGLGYLICGHTNLLDSYKIAKRWSEDNCLRDRDGSLHQFGNWGGGNSYFLCPKKAHAEYAGEDMEAMRELGFHGTHYLDVMTILPPNKCHDPRHPLNRKEAAEWRGKTMALAREKIGASASEGSWDFCIGDVDYVLYTIFHRNGEFRRPLVDRHLPFWHLVYHGIVHYNTFCDSVNASIKSDPRLGLMNLAWGGRPLSYFHAKFLSTGTNWMGDEDLGFSTPERLAEDVAKIKKDYDRFRTLSDLQFEFMETFEELAADFYRVAYADGSTLLFNLSDEARAHDGRACPARDFVRY